MSSRCWPTTSSSLEPAQSRQRRPLGYPRNIPRASPRILEFSRGGEFRHLEPNGNDALDGFGNLEVGDNYPLFTDAAHEAIASIGLEADMGGAGDRRAGSAPFSTLSPTLFSHVFL